MKIKEKIIYISKERLLASEKEFKKLVEKNPEFQALEKELLKNVEEGDR